MASLRELIKTNILTLLSDGKARKARELVGMLRSQLGREDIEKQEVNSVLYRDLAGSVDCDATFNWGVRSSHAKPQSIPANERGEKEDLPSKSRLIRTVSRLRSGLPPYENLEHLTVGEDRLAPALTKMLSVRPDNSSTWAIARGDYGAGKSHALALYNELARNEGYAVCHISADGLNCALNHPQRFLSSMFSTMEIPFRPTYGYTDLLHDVLADFHLTARLKEFTARHLDGWSTMAVETRYCLERITKTLASGSNLSDEWRECVRMVTLHMTGDTIRHLTASPQHRRTAYALLSIARDLVLDLGMKGLAIGIDELESMYTKLPTSRSRQGAMRVLSALCTFGNCRVVLAITPDAYRQLIADIPFALYDSFNCLPTEDLARWSTALTSSAVPVIDCRPLDAGDRECLLRTISEVYPQVYGRGFATPLFDKSWAKYVANSRQSPVPTRILIRQAIDLMDSFRYRSSLRPTQ